MRLSKEGKEKINEVKNEVEKVKNKAEKFVDDNPNLVIYGIGLIFGYALGKRVGFTKGCANVDNHLINIANGTGKAIISTHNDKLLGVTVNDLDNFR